MTSEKASLKWQAPADSGFPLVAWRPRTVDHICPTKGLWFLISHLLGASESLTRGTIEAHPLAYSVTDRTALRSPKTEEKK